MNHVHVQAFHENEVTDLSKIVFCTIQAYNERFNSTSCGRPAQRHVSTRGWECERYGGCTQELGHRLAVS